MRAKIFEAIGLAHADTFWTIGAAYDFGTIYLPAALFVLGWALLIVRRGRPRRRLAISCFILSVLGPGLRVWASYIEPNNISVRRFSIRSKKVKQPFAIAHLSDIQSAHVTDYEAKLIALTASLRPDLVVHTGDLSQPQPPEAIATEALRIGTIFERLHGPKLAVLGDVDRALRTDLRAGLGGFELLEDEPWRTERGGTRVELLGLSPKESHDPTLARPVIEAWLAKTPAQSVRVVMGHAPDFALAIGDLPVDLALAGHTHGGQIRLPGIGPLMTLSRVPKEWAWGAHKTGNVWLNVSAGIGAEHAYGLPSIRLNCPPEIVMIDLLPDTNEPSCDLRDPSAKSRCTGVDCPGAAPPTPPSVAKRAR